MRRCWRRCCSAAAPARGRDAAALARRPRRVRDALFDAQTELILGTPQSAARHVARARARPTAASCARGIRAAGPAADAALRGARSPTPRERPPRATTSTRARGRARRGPRGDLPRRVRGHARRRRARRRRDRARVAAAARVPHRHALHAPGRQRARSRSSGSAAGRLDAERAPRRPSPRTCSTPTRRACASCSTTPTAAPSAGCRARRAEAAAQAAGYWPILAARYAEDRGAAAADAARRRRSPTLAATARGRRRAPRTRAARDRGATRARRASPPRRSPPRRRARRAQQLLRFLALVPVEYGRGVDGTTASRSTSRSRRRSRSAPAPTAAFADLADPARQARRGAHRRRSRPTSTRLGAARRAGDRAARGRPDRRRRSKAHRRRSVEDDLNAIDADGLAGEPTDESDYDLIALTLDRMEAAVGAGQYRQAEQARLEAYAFFEFGPERRLKAFDPGLAVDIEGLIWYGATGEPGLATLIAKRAPRREMHETRARARRAARPTPPPRSATARARRRSSPTRRSSSSARASRRC